MVTIDRKWAGIIPYKTIFFLTEAALQHVVQSLRFTEMARMFYAKTAISNARCLIKYQPSFAVCNDLHQSQSDLWSKFADYDRYEIRRAER
jgi:hypothetical protein